MTDDDKARGAPGRAGERLFYRDEDELKKALDAASESIRTAQGPDIVGNVVWWGLLALLAILYLSDWVLGWEVRDQIIPGVDVTKPLWIVVIAIAVAHHVWKRHRHPRILSRRLCFGCGKSLLGVRVNALGDGACAACGRGFNLGEYRRPRENRGRGFQGYIDRRHFDRAMYAAAGDIRRARGAGLEGEFLGWCWVALGISFGASILLDWDLLDWIPAGHAAPLVILPLWSAFYGLRIGRLGPAIAQKRLCMNCGYCLLGTPTDDEGLGRCPECGEAFAFAQYEPPAAIAPSGRAGPPRGASRPRAT